MDRAIPDAAKLAVTRKMSEGEARRTKILAAVDGLHEDANSNTEGPAAIIRETFAAARENLHAVATPAEFNRFVERFLGAATWRKRKRPRRVPQAFLRTT